MVWFSCEDCGDSIKKPKLQAHMAYCSASRLTCLDCNVTFRRDAVKGHTQCVTEHEKYAEGKTKAAGFKGIANHETSAQDLGAGNTISMPHGPPWICRICNVTCTSRDTLLGHMQGAKHTRKARAALKATSENKESHTIVNSPATKMTEEQPSKRQKLEKDAHSDFPTQSGSEKPQERSASCPTDGTQAGVARKVTSSEGKKGIKWKKLAAQELKAVDGLKLKVLLRNVLLAAGRPDSKEAREQALKRITSSSRIEIENGFARCRSKAY